MRRSGKALLLAAGTCLLHDDFRRVGPLVTSCPYDPDGKPLRPVVYPGGAGWTTAGSAASNAPDSGAEMLADPGLEAAYTAGRCSSLGASGTPTLAQSADVHGGAKAQQFTAAAQDDRLYVAFATVAGQWYRGTAWAKRTAGVSGTAKVVLSGGGISTMPSSPVTSAAYAAYRVTQRASSGAGGVLRTPWESGNAGFDTIIVDDVSVVPLSMAGLLNVPELGVCDVTAEVDLSALPASVQCGLALRWDSQAAPANGILVCADGLGNIRADKCVAGVVTPNIITGAVSGGGTCRVRLVGDTLSITYKGAAVGASANVADVPRGRRHGLFATDASASQVTRLTIRQGV